ncbi:hypothetical protein [uncultured Roseobacter sp.]|uniref:hypothetical protein n=1 Tax=uncultured Roseobacter sp. TaxID=114847 RepID=UPI00261E8B38|nr:hypothetical protein [uncultured Roseobacter sp.]
MADPARKTVWVHIGPHKTGTTALQSYLRTQEAHLAKSGVAYVSTDETLAAARDLAHGHFADAERRLAGIAARLTDIPVPQVLLSHEDLAGNLPGRDGGRRIYPRLTKNLRILRRALRPHRVEVVFFTRTETDWLRSCYHQHLRFRTRFADFAAFKARYDDNFQWERALAKPRELLGKRLHILPYGTTSDAGTRALLQLMKVEPPPGGPATARRNAAPAPEEIRALERINALSSFPATAWFAKTLIGRHPPAAAAPRYPPWPPDPPAAPATALPALAGRVGVRVRFQDCPDILPAPNVDLATLADRRLPDMSQAPEISRRDIRDQAEILRYHLRRKSELAHLTALTISYLRRATPHTDKARALFHRIWHEQGHRLINELSTRWLLSTLQTFLDHGQTEAQRAIGTAGYFYGNMLKTYEAERAIEGRPADAPYEALTPQTDNRFRGLDRYPVGGSDLMLNMNALALELAQRDDTAGLVLQEFLLRVKTAETVFSRHDRTRWVQQVSVAGFEDVWAFFDPWTA